MMSGKFTGLSDSKLWSGVQSPFGGQFSVFNMLEDRAMLEDHEQVSEKDWEEHNEI